MSATHLPQSLTLLSLCCCFFNHMHLGKKATTWNQLNWSFTWCLCQHRWLEGHFSGQSGMTTNLRTTCIPLSFCSTYCNTLYNKYFHVSLLSSYPQLLPNLSLPPMTGSYLAGKISLWNENFISSHIQSYLRLPLPSPFPLITIKESGLGSLVKANSFI